MALLIPAVSSAQTIHEVDVSDGNSFEPEVLTINRGDTVRWVNSISVFRHNVVSEDDLWEPIDPDHEFIFEVTFPDAGEFNYFCGPHEEFHTGIINVEGAGMLVPPQADFSSNCNDLDCDFTDQSTDGDGQVTSWSWNFGDGEISTLVNPSHSYPAEGVYNVELVVTDDDGQTDSVNKDINVTEPDTPPFLINPAISDAWFFPDTSGQGFFIIVWEDSKLIFLSWFTYETELPPEDVTAILGKPEHRWLTALGPYEEATALLDVFLSSGMIFDSPVPVVDTEQLEGATIEIVWTGCNEGVVKYDIPSLGLMGEIPIERIVQDNVAACMAAQPQ